MTGDQMRRTHKEKTLDFWIRLGRKNPILRIFAVAGLSVCLLFFRVTDYCKHSTKRFACVLFILMMFMAGNSFAYPVFQKDSGFTDASKSSVDTVVTEDDSLTLAQESDLSSYDASLFDEEDDIYTDIGPHGMDSTQTYSYSEILEEGLLSDAPLTDSSYEENNVSEDNGNGSFSADDWNLILVNKQHPIPDDYELSLGNIKTVKGTMKCDERIIEELLSMMQAASDHDVMLAICSPYRDLNYQETLFNRKIEAYMKKGMSYMDAYTLSSQAVTVPGSSEHQIGLAIDIISDDYVTLDEGFAETAAGKWLAQHSYEYGFILRYPEGKEDITGIEFEPWHFRYVGKKAAEIITKEGITLEEFWDKYL